MHSDYGMAVAADAARLAVAPLHRSAGQAQYIVWAPGQDMGEGRSRTRQFLIP
ncbi:MAG: hypothetical protein ACRDOI_25090 [Trebonia sp.]